ncbi:MAG: DNA-binding response regulator [Flavobacteriales bacterium]|nr:MAG: DNA-binding response regulator [Flavobacteriales bacterium]
MEISCVIIDDEPLAIAVLKNHISQINNVVLKASFSNPIEGFNYVKDKKTDLLFLDINMPLLDGINFVKSLDDPPLIVFTTAYEKYAVESFELEVQDYLLKPISFQRFLKCIKKVEKSYKIKHNLTRHALENPYIFIKKNNKTLKKIFLNEILVIESLKDYLKVKTKTNKYIIHSTLTSFTEQLPADNFIRIHRSFTVAIDKIDTITGNQLEIDGIKYSIGRTYIDDVKQKILDSSS